jgi:hypothetical protein
MFMAWCINPHRIDMSLTHFFEKKKKKIIVRPVHVSLKNKKFHFKVRSVASYRFDQATDVLQKVGALSGSEIVKWC